MDTMPSSRFCPGTGQKCAAGTGTCLLPQKPTWHSTCSLGLETMAADVIIALKTSPFQNPKAVLHCEIKFLRPRSSEMKAFSEPL